jgi:Cu-Zn family superoxide dismutase
MLPTGIRAGALATLTVVLATGAAHASGPHDPDGPHGFSMRTDARFAPPSAFVPSAAVTYDQGLVPAAAWIQVDQRTTESGATTVTLRVRGFSPGHAYGAHVHQRPCAADPAAAGGRYQHVPGTGMGAGAGRKRLDADNEVRLDFATDARGTGGARAQHGWGFRRGEAASVVIYDVPHTDGTPVACFTVPFGWIPGT